MDLHPIALASWRCSVVPIFVVDDNPTVRRYLRAILEQHDSWRVCGDARTGAEALSKVMAALRT